jgi:Gram-negative bacterial TonB protein C-terminal
MTAHKLSFFVVLAAFAANGPSSWTPTRISSLQYPVLGLQAQLQGNVVLKIRVVAPGTVSSVEVVSGNPVLAGAARDNIKTWKFGRVCNSGGNSNEPATMEFNYEFQLEGIVESSPKTDFEFEYPNRVKVKSSAVHWTP